MLRDLNATKLFLETMDNVEKEWDNWIEELRQCEFEIRDLLHEVELTKFDIQRGYKLSKQFQEVRQRRRELKNIVEISRPLKEFIDSNKQLKISLFKVLNKMEKTIELQGQRKYAPRVRMDITLADNG